jgi:hypothetical protein
VKSKAFDFLDIVHHIQCNLKTSWNSKYQNQLRIMIESLKVDYMIVDEVQDLQPKTI